MASAKLHALTSAEAVRDASRLAAGCTEEQEVSTRSNSDVHEEEEEEEEEVSQVERQEADPLNTNSLYFHSFAKLEDFPSGSFTKVCKVATGLNGDIFKYTYQGGKFGSNNNNTTTIIAVKQLSKEHLLSSDRSLVINEREWHFEKGNDADCSPDDALAEIGILQLLAKQPDLPLYVLKLLGTFADDSSVWVCSEFADGGELFNLADSGSASDTQVRQYACEILQAVNYLHRLHISHRDLSLENMLIKNGSVRVIDFGMSVQSHSATSGELLRYFRCVGKNFYRAPECYVPTQPEVSVVVPHGGVPLTVVPAVVDDAYWCEVRLPANAIPNKACKAEVMGYTGPSADMFSCGICLFMLAWHCPPWEKAILADPCFSFFWRNRLKGIRTLLDHWRKPSRSNDLIELITKMLSPESTLRPHAADCLGSPYLAPLASRAVPLHSEG
jgi:serine/threonine protein kinase